MKGRKNLFYYILIAILGYLIYMKWKSMEGMEGEIALSPASVDKTKTIPMIEYLDKVEKRDKHNFYHIKYIDDTTIGVSPPGMLEQEIFSMMLVLKYVKNVDLFKQLNRKTELSNELFKKWDEMQTMWKRYRRENEARLNDMLTKLNLYGINKYTKEQEKFEKYLNENPNVVSEVIAAKYYHPLSKLYKNTAMLKTPKAAPYLPILLYSKFKIMDSEIKAIELGMINKKGYFKGEFHIMPLIMEVLVHLMGYKMVTGKDKFNELDKTTATYKLLRDMKDMMESFFQQHNYEENTRRIIHNLTKLSVI
jgi:hypothetical protein